MVCVVVLRNNATSQQRIAYAPIHPFFDILISYVCVFERVFLPTYSLQASQ